MTTALRGFRAASVFLTRVPVGGFPYTKEEWRWSAAWFPLVGWVLGLASAGVWLLVARAGPGVAAMSVLTFSILVTGAFHEDGLADSADALGGAYDRAKIFVILKDSRVGAFGALALVLTVAFRLVLLVELDSWAPLALVVMHCLARLGPVWLMVAMPYVTDEAAKSRLVTRAGRPQGVLATAASASAMLCVGAIVPASVVPILAAALAMLMTTVVCGLRFRARADGVTGDFLGACEQLNEVTILFALLLMTR